MIEDYKIEAADKAYYEACCRGQQMNAMRAALEAAALPIILGRKP